MRKSRSTWIVITIGLGFLLGSLLAELAVRVYRYGPDSLLPAVMNSLHPIGTSGMIRASIPELGYELKPGLDRLYKKVPLRTNSAGLRDREYAREKPPGTFRIVVLGDSFSMPTGVVIEEAYHTRVEDRLNEKARASGSSIRYEVLNFAVGGYQLPQYLALLEERALAWQPDLILVGLSTNDHVFFQVLADRFNEPYRVKETTSPLFESELVAWIRRQSGPDFGGSPRETVLSAAFRKHVDEYFGRLTALARARDIPLVFVFLAPYRWQFASLRHELEGIAAEKGALFIDASRLLPEQEDLGLRIFRADGHPNGRANALFAETIEPALISRGLVPDPASGLVAPLPD